MDNLLPNQNNTAQGMVPLNQASSDNPYVKSFQAAIAQPVVGLQTSQAGLAQAQLAVTQQDYFTKARKELEAAKDPKTGYVDPQVYNRIKNEAPSGVSSDSIDQQFEHDYTDPTQIGYNTPTGYGNRTALGGVTRQIEAKLLQYGNIPSIQKGPLKGIIADIPILGQYLSPEAVTYEGERTGLAAQLKSLLGGATGIRVTAAQLEGWSNLIPTATDTQQVADDKIRALDKDIKATFNSPQGLHPAFLPQQSGQPPQETQQGPVGGGTIPGAPAATNSMSDFVNNFAQLSKPTPNPLNGILQTGLPIAGALAGGAIGAVIPGLGETGASEIAGAGVGGAAGQGLADILTGKQPGADVPVTGGLMAAGGAVGVAGGAVLKSLGILGSSVTPEVAAGAEKLGQTALNEPGLLMRIMRPTQAKSVVGGIRDAAVSTADKSGVKIAGDDVAAAIARWGETAKMGNIPDTQAIEQAVADAAKSYAGKTLKPSDLYDVYKSVESGYTSGGSLRTSTSAYIDNNIKSIISGQLEKVTPGFAKANEAFSKIYSMQRSSIGKVAKALPGNVVRTGIQAAGLGAVLKLTQ